MGRGNHKNLTSLNRYLQDIALDVKQLAGSHIINEQLELFFKNAISNLKHYQEEMLKLVRSYFK